MKYRKKPVVIEAENVKDLIVMTSQNWQALPKWVEDAYDSGILVFTPTELHIKTLEGVMIANEDDYLIQGVQGELYPCKPDIFTQTYEPVEQTGETE